MPGMAAETPAPAATRRGLWRWTLYAALTIVLAVVGTEAVRVIVGFNFHTVLPGRLYRCAQPTGRDVESLVRDHGVRTVVNLRGRLDDAQWFEDESRTCQRLGVSNEILTMSAMRLPARHEVRRLVEILDRADRPIALHCRQGADRTGLATAVALLLEPGIAYDDAKSRLGLRWGHWPIGPTAKLDRFFHGYEAWLAARGESHSPDRFRLWINEGYSAGPAAYEIVSAIRLDAEPRAKQLVSYRVRFRNTSGEPWQFRSTRGAGIHAFFQVFAENGAAVYMNSAGFLETVVAPGEEIELVIPVAFLDAGRYVVRIDLRDEQHGSFAQCGQEPFEEELIVRE